MYYNRQRILIVTVLIVFVLIVIFQFHFNRNELADIRDNRVQLFHPTNDETLVLPGPEVAEVINILHNEQENVNKSDDAGNTYRRRNRGIAFYSQKVMKKISAMTSRKAKSDDSELISLVRDVMDLPSAGPIKPSRSIQRTPQVVEVELILNNKRSGFFVECGGLDGERSSNTVYLEQQRQWTGLLVEADPHYYTQLLGKSRRSWSINACLSPYGYVTELPFYGDSGGKGRISVASNPNRNQKTVPCFPFETLMLALNRTHIDYFSLDVEGMEFPILRTIPFDRFTFDVISVEYGHDLNGKRETVEFMNDAGYVLYKDINTAQEEISLFVEDFIFVRKALVAT